MGISFEIYKNEFILCYAPMIPERADYISDSLRKGKEINLKNTYCVSQNLVREYEHDDDFETTFRFCIGIVNSGYIKLDSTVFGTDHDFFISLEIHLKPQMFVAYRNISILRKIDNLIQRDFYIGGDWQKHNGISFEAFKHLIDTFPKSAELDHYANMRISTILKEYFPECEKYKDLYENFIQKKSSALINTNSNQKNTPKYSLKIEQAKFEYTIAKLKDMLNHYESIPEKEWQEQICEILRFIYPKYIAYSRETKYRGCDEHDKKPDFLLVDSSGFVDILEIKKANVLVLSPELYRYNYVPSRELLGAIQQTEKYIFCLNTVKEAKDTVCKRLSTIVPGVEAKILNPQGMILLGRSTEFENEQQIADFELIKRQYKHIADIMTYDDLLNRLENIISALRETNSL